MRIILIMICAKTKAPLPADRAPSSAAHDLLPGAQFRVAMLDSAALLGGRDEVEIVHQGETYRLRRTRQGKLILTK